MFNFVFVILAHFINSQAINFLVNQINQLFLAVQIVLHQQHIRTLNAGLVDHSLGTFRNLSNRLLPPWVLVATS